MTITYKKRSIKKARTKKKVFGNKKQTYKRSTNKWSIRRKRGGMDKVENPEKPKQQRPNGSTPEGAPTGAMQVDSQLDLPPARVDSPITQQVAKLANRPAEMLPSEEVEQSDGLNDNERHMVNNLFDDIKNDKKEQTDGSCENEIKMGNELLDDINDDDLASIDAAEINNLKAVTGFADLDDVFTGDQPDGLEASEALKTPTKKMYTRKKVIERLKHLLATPKKQAMTEGRFTGMADPTKLPFSPDSSQENPSSAPAPASSSSAASAPASSSSSDARAPARAPARATRSPNFTGETGTPEVIISCSKVNFLEVLVIYLNIKKKSWNLPSRIDLYNCWDILFDMYEKRGFKKVFKDIIVKYSNSSLFDKTSFNRNVFQQFVIDCVDYGVAEEMKLAKNVGRDAFPGEQLKDANVEAANARGDFFFKSPQHVTAEVENEELKPEEVDWIKKCIGIRKQLWIDNPLLRNADGSPDYETSKQDMKTEINNKYSSWTYWKQVCGICWICKKPIYFYYMTKNEDGTGEKIDLNTQCGQIEHVLPPTVGDIFGTLHTSASVFKKVVTANGTETIYTYGLAPSHAFCNQMKGMFVFTPIFFGGDVKAEWTKEVDSWFRAPRYDSFEFYPEFIQTWEGFYDTYNGHEASCYAVTTYKNVKKYLEDNIQNRLTAQAAHQDHTMKSVTQLKLAIFCQKFAYEHSNIFKTKWDVKDSSDAARGTPGRR